MDHPAVVAVARSLETAPLMPVTRPHPDEYAPYFGSYVELVPQDIITHLLRDLATAPARLLEGVTREGSLHRYAPGKWSVRQVVAHVTDIERVFCSRALWFARPWHTSLWATSCTTSGCLSSVMALS